MDEDDWDEDDEDDDWDSDFDECSCCCGPCDCYNEGRCAPDDYYEEDDNEFSIAHDPEDFGDDDLGNKAFDAWMQREPEEVESGGKGMSKIEPRHLTDEEFDTIAELIENCPEAESVAWDLNVRSLAVRFKKPAADKSKSIAWADQLSNVVIQSAPIIAKLWAEILYLREQQADSEPVNVKPSGKNRRCFKLAEDVQS